MRALSCKFAPVRWCKLMLEENTTVSKMKQEKWKEVNEDVGTYKAFDRIVWLEGNTASAVTAAINYVTKAMRMGGQWIHWNPMTERTDVLYVKKSHRSIFRSMWGMFCEQTHEVEAQQPDQAQEAIGIETPQKQKGKAKAKGKGKNKRKHVKEQTEEEKDAQKEAKKARLDLVRKAEATKSVYLKTMAVHHQLLGSIANDKSYAWANNEATAARLRAAESAVVSRVEAHVFHKFCLVNDMSEVKKANSDDELCNNLRHFATELDAVLSSLSKEHTRLNKMHLASCQE